MKDRPQLIDLLVTYYLFGRSDAEHERPPHPPNYETHKDHSFAYLDGYDSLLREESMTPADIIGGIAA